jgi:hypothetical protein
MLLTTTTTTISERERGRRVQFNPFAHIKLPRASLNISIIFSFYFTPHNKYATPHTCTYIRSQRKNH